MTTRLALASIAVDNAMGQQVYERELGAGADTALGGDPTWDVTRFEVATLRTPGPVVARIPSRVFASSSPTLRSAVGRLLYRRYDIVHRLDLRLPPAPHAEILTILDVVPWRYPDEGPAPADAAATARRADVVICPSEFSVEEVAATLGVSHAVAIPLGVSSAFRDATPLSEAELRDLGIEGPYIVHAGGSTERKNLAGLADAWGRLTTSRPDLSLVLMGPPDERRDRLFASLPRTVRTGRLGDADARGVLAGAAVVVVPSLYEGFGLPALEGMAVGVPVVAARRSSLPEVCGDAAHLVEPDGRSLALGIEAALAGGPDIGAMVERGRRRAAEFTWERSLEAHAAVWRSLS